MSPDGLPSRVRAVADARRRGIVAVLLLGISPGLATAQSAVPTFLTRADVAFQWAGLAAADDRFSWNGRFRVDVDVLDTGRWRLGFTADYDAIIGGERRTFDLNQGTYLFDGVAARRFGASEVALVTRHVSRHLVDRDNVPAISWNLAGARVSHVLTVGTRTTIAGEIEVGRAMQQAFVDYLWTSDLRLALRHRRSERLEWLGRAEGGVIGTMPRVAGRPRLCGGRVEAALRLNGHRAALEVFAGYERRIDAFPSDRFRVRFSSVGFRIVSR